MSQYLYADARISITSKQYMSCIGLKKHYVAWMNDEVRHNINDIPCARTVAVAETIQVIVFQLCLGRNNPSLHLCLCALRIVNYEAGKGASKARSLWRLEPLRIR